MFANNTNFPLTILFMINEERENHDMIEHELTRSILPNDVFRAPLKWFTMQNIRIDAYLIRKTMNFEDDIQEQRQPLFENIQEAFSKTGANQNDKDFLAGLKSHTVQLNGDFYVSVDISGYKCLPN